MVYPTTNGIKSFKNGDQCSDGSVGSLKVYVNGKKIHYFVNYVFYPDAYVPPGDCILIIFDSSTTNETNQLCDTWDIQGWSYDNFTREKRTVGDFTW